MGALLAKIGQGIKNIPKLMKRVLAAGVSLATFRWLAGGRQGPPPMEETQEVEEPAPSAEAFDQAFETEANPFQRKRKGFEPQDVLNFLKAETSHERAQLSGRLKTTTWSWAESLTLAERKAVLLAGHEGVRNHLSGTVPIAGVPSIAAAMSAKLRDPGMNPYAPDLAARVVNDNDRRVVQLHPDQQKAAQVVFGKRANDRLPAREAQAIEAGTAEVVRDAEKTARRCRAAATMPMPRPRRAAGFAFG